MSEPFSQDRINRSLALVAEQAPTADAHEVSLLVCELDLLAEQLVGRHDLPSVAQKAAVQHLVHELCPARSAYPPADTSQ